MSLLGIDIGSTGCKAAAFDHDGRQIALAYQEYPVSSPEPNWAQLDSRRVMRAFQDNIRKVAAETGNDPITALAISSQGEAVTPIDTNGEIIGDAFLSFDPRTEKYAAWWAERIPARQILAITGQPPAAIFSLCKIMWFRDCLPDVFARADKFLNFQDLGCHLLGLDPAIDYSMAARTMAFDVGSLEWSETMLGAAGLSADLFPRAIPAGALVGAIPNAMADDLGLPHGVAAYAGGHDQPCGALGCGAITPGVSMYSTGTVDCIAPALAERLDHPKMLDYGICSYPHVLPDEFITLAYNFTGGSVLKWYRDTFGRYEMAEAERSGGDVYDLLIAQCPDDPTGLMLLPHFAPTGTPHFDAHSAGVMAGLKLSTTRGEFIKALLEGVTYEIKLNVELLAEMGVTIKQYRLIGGGAKSDAYVQLKADILGTEVVCPDVTEAACLGAALLAGIGSGVYASAPEAVAAAVTVKKTVEPDSRKNGIYTDRFAQYRQLYPALRDLLHNL